MSTTLPLRSALRSTTSAPEALRFRLLAGIPLLAGIFLSFMGLAWDVQWHGDVGPDTFFTLPHLVLYSGVALAGLTAMAVVLYSSYTYHAGKSIFPVETLTAVLGGRFWAPASFIIGGCGSALFLLFGLYDEWWHSIYGFDVTIFSPPHVGLLFSIVINMVGCIALFAGARQDPPAGFPIGAILGLTSAVAILLGIISVFVELVGLLPLITDPHQTGMALVFTAGMFLIAALTRQPGAVTLLAGFYTGLWLLIWFIVPWATLRYAEYLALYPRDDATGIAEVATAMPALTLLAALVVDLGLAVARRQGYGVRLSVMVLGAVAGLILLLPWQYYPPPFPSLSPATSLWVGGLAPGLAWIGWKLGVLLRHLQL